MPAELKHEEDTLHLDELEPGTRFLVRAVETGGELGTRLGEMGFVPGTKGCVIRSALLGDPIQIRLLGYDISLRRKEAAGIAVERIHGRCRGSGEPHGHGCRHG